MRFGGIFGFLGFMMLAARGEALGLQVRWLGVAGLSITDGQSTLLIDPTFTKPSLKHWITGSEFKSDPDRVREGLGRAQVKVADAIFASHGHFDHAVDLARVSEATGATIHGGISLRRIVTADPAIRINVREIKDREEVRVGRFRVTPYLREHPPIFHLGALHFLPGVVPDGFHFRFYDYHEGEVWGFRIEHPEASVIVDQSSHFFPGNSVFSGKTDAYFVGVANKVSLQDLVQNNILALHPSLVVPLHFDFFLLNSRLLEGLRMPFMQLGAIEKALRSADPAIRFKVPDVDQVIEVKKMTTP